MKIPEEMTDFNVSSAKNAEGKIGYNIEGTFKGRKVSIFVPEGEKLKLQDQIALMEINVKKNSLDNKTRFQHFTENASDEVKGLFNQAMQSQQIQRDI